MRCPSCGFENLAGADWCEGCKQPLAGEEPAGADAGLERDLRTDPVSLLRPARPITVSPNDAVGDVVRLLAERGIGCALVTWCDALVGIFTERDVLMKIGDRYAAMKDMPVRHFMTPVPESLASEDSIAFALNRMAVGGFRHVPIEKDERPVGIISVRDVLDYLARHFPELLAGRG